MIASMTGYGSGEAVVDGISAAVEIRSVNSRYFEVTARLPRSLSIRENEIKEIARRRLSRGKINVVVAVGRENASELPLRINAAAAKAYFRLLNELRKAVKLRETVKLDHLLHFPEVIEAPDIEPKDEKEWGVVQTALEKAIEQVVRMRLNEGGELKKDFLERIESLEEKLSLIETLSASQIPSERERLHERVKLLLNGEPVDAGRLELELALLADRLDVTEECVRFRSHNKFFLSALDDGESAGRKLNFLVQEMNREANTIGSKSGSAEIAHIVVRVKEELEKIREQLQNIE